MELFLQKVKEYGLAAVHLVVATRAPKRTFVFYKSFGFQPVDPAREHLMVLEFRKPRKPIDFDNESVATTVTSIGASDTVVDPKRTRSNTTNNNNAATSKRRRPSPANKNSLPGYI